MSFRRSEIGSEQCISKEPRNLCDYPTRLSHDDFAPMFTPQSPKLDYNDNRVEAATAQLEDSPLGTFLLGDAYQVPDWTGAPARLLAEFAMLAGERVAASPRWPKSARAFTVELRRIAPLLRAHGIFVTVSWSHQGRDVSTSRDPELAQDDRDTPDVIADEEFGAELDTQENLRHGQPSSQV